MKNPALIIVTIIIAAIGIGGYTLYTRSSQTETMMPKEESMIKDEADAVMDAEETSMMENDEKTNEEEGMMDEATTQAQYVPYTNAAFDTAEQNRRVLFFYASWCPTCRPADADFSANAADIPEGVTVLRVNYNDPDTDDAEKQLAQKYGVTYQHTFVQIDSTGQEITKWNGGQLTELLSNIR